MNTITLFQKFRQLVYQVLPKRADATLDLIDALTVAGHVDSPVALSEEAPFRRKISSVYDVLSEGEIEEEKLHPILYEQQPEDCETMGGYEVYGLDTTPDDRPEAETLDESPASPPRLAGKGHGRPKGYCSSPRKHHKVVRKGKKSAKKAPATANLAA